MAPSATKLRLAPEALALLTDGVELRGVKLRPWYERESAGNIFPVEFFLTKFERRARGVPQRAQPMSPDVQSEVMLLCEFVATLRTENTLLRQKIDLLVRRVFGSSSERLDPAQLELLLQLSAAPAPVEGKTFPGNKTSTASRRKPVPRLPDNLPVVEEVIEPEPVKAAPQPWRCIGEEVSEQLDYEPGRFLRRRIIRKKYGHRTEADRAPVIAPLPERLQERGLAAPGLLAHVIVSKYCDHLPLYRQEQIYRRRHGVHLPRQTLARWMELAADWLKPIYEQIRTGVMAGGYIQVDAPPLHIWNPATARPGRVTFGRAPVRAEM